MEPNERVPASMRSAVAAVLVLPTVVGIAAPLAMASVDPWAAGFLAPGLVIVAAGVAIVAATVHEFFTQGRGTLAPWDPPRRLVTTGLFARCRNPMYIGVVSAVVGHALTFRSPIVAGYAFLLLVTFHVRVLVYEEPWAARSFPDDWPRYVENVPRWVPRLRPWAGGEAHD